MKTFEINRTYGADELTIRSIKLLDTPFQTHGGLQIGVIRYEKSNTQFTTSLFKNADTEYFYAYSFGHKRVEARQLNTSEFEDMSMGELQDMMYHVETDAEREYNEMRNPRR